MNDARTDAAGLDELLNPRVAHAHQGKFGGGEEGIGCHQKQDEKHPQQHKSNHEEPILTLAVYLDRDLRAKLL